MVCFLSYNSIQEAIGIDIGIGIGRLKVTFIAIHGIFQDSSLKGL